MRSPKTERMAKKASAVSHGSARTEAASSSPIGSAVASPFCQSMIQTAMARQTWGGTRPRFRCASRTGTSRWAIFWLLSGVIGLAQFDEAVTVLTKRGFEEAAAGRLVLVGAVLDIALGTAVLVRRLARPAALGMVALSLGYLGAATLFAADLWAEPLGPLVKVLPGMTLAFIAAALLDER